MPFSTLREFPPASALCAASPVPPESRHTMAHLRYLPCAGASSSIHSGTFSLAPTCRIVRPDTGGHRAAYGIPMDSPETAENGIPAEDREPE